MEIIEYRNYDGNNRTFDVNIENFGKQTKYFDGVSTSLILTYNVFGLRIHEIWY